jgi:predicted DNA-binding WGR domain protein
VMIQKIKDRRKRQSRKVKRDGYVAFTHVDPQANMFRYYVLFEPEQTMFKNIYAVKMVYGRMRTSTRCVYKIFNSLEAANAYRLKCYKTRLRHGYVKVAGDTL